MWKNRRESLIGCEALEIRRLLAVTLVVNDTPGVDTITVGVTAAGGISTNVNGAQKDYAPGEWDGLLVQSNRGPDTINVRATVVPTVVYYVADVNINVGDAGGVQNIKAELNMNGSVGGPAIPAVASISVNNGADTTPRNIVMSLRGAQEVIAGLAPAPITVGVEFEPVSPLPVEPIWNADRVSLTTGSGADAIKINGLRHSTPTTIFGTGGNDAIVVGDGTLADVLSPITIWGGALTSLQAAMTVRLDDSRNPNPAEFTLSALYIRDKGPMERIAFGPAFLETEVAFQVSQVSTASVDAGPGGNRFVIEDIAPRVTDPGPALTLNTGSGNDNVVVNKSGAGTSLKVNGEAGDDTLKAGAIGPWDGVNGSLGFDGDGGFNALIVQGPKASPLAMPSVAVSVYAGRVEHIGVEYRYTGVSRLTLQNGWFMVRENLGPIELVVTSEPSEIQFESPRGVVQVNASQKLTSLTIKSGAMELSRGGDKQILTGMLSMADDGSLDLADNQMEVNWNVASPFPEIRRSIFAKRIFSSAADARHNLGYADQPGGIDFAPFGTVRIRYTLYGDANLDRRVNFTDLAALAQHYNDTSGQRNWDEGDFTYEGNVDFKDLALLSQNYNQAMAAAEGVVAARAAAETGRPAPAVRRRPK